MGLFFGPPIIDILYWGTFPLEHHNWGIYWLDFLVGLFAKFYNILQRLNLG